MARKPGEFPPAPQWNPVPPEDRPTLTDEEYVEDFIRRLLMGTLDFDARAPIEPEEPEALQAATAKQDCCGRGCGACDED